MIQFENDYGSQVTTDLGFFTSQHRFIFIHHGVHDLIIPSAALFGVDACLSTENTIQPPIYPWAVWGSRSRIINSPHSIENDDLVSFGHRIIFKDCIWDFSPCFARNSHTPSPKTTCHSCNTECPYIEEGAEGTIPSYKVVPIPNLEEFYWGQEKLVTESRTGPLVCPLF